MATHSNILAWKMDRGALEGYSPWGCKELDTNECLRTSLNWGEGCRKKIKTLVLNRDASNDI